MVKCVLYTQRKWDSQAGNWVEGEKNMGGISFLEGKWEKKMSFLLVFSFGDFERLYLGFSGRIHMQIREPWNFKISREICKSQCELPYTPRTLRQHPACAQPCRRGSFFLVSFPGSPFYFLDNLVFRKFSPLSRKCNFIQSLPIGPSYTSDTLLIIFANFMIWKAGAKMGWVTCA